MGICPNCGSWVDEGDICHGCGASGSYITSEDENELLPVNEYESQIVESVKSHEVVLVTGETGSGKSTQIPQLLYRNGFD